MDHWDHRITWVVLVGLSIATLFLLFQDRFPRVAFDFGRSKADFDKSCEELTGDPNFQLAKAYGIAGQALLERRMPGLADLSSQVRLGYSSQGIPFIDYSSARGLSEEEVRSFTQQDINTLSYYMQRSDDLIDLIPEVLLNDCLKIIFQ